MKMPATLGQLIDVLENVFLKVIHSCMIPRDP